MTHEEMIREIASAETRAAMAAQIAEDAERRRAQAETKCVAAEHRVEMAERAVAAAEEACLTMERDGAVHAFDACEDMCKHYLADQPSHELTKAGYVNATMGILGRVQALRDAAKHPDTSGLAKKLARLVKAPS